MGDINNEEDPGVAAAEHLLTRLHTAERERVALKEALEGVLAALEMGLELVVYDRDGLCPRLVSVAAFAESLLEGLQKNE